MKLIIVWALYFAGIMLLFSLTFIALCLLPEGDKEPAKKESGRTGKE